MTIEPRKSAEDFLKTVTAVKAPDLYLAGCIARNGGHRTSPSTAKQPVDASVTGVPLRILTANAVPIPPKLTDTYEQCNLNGAQGARHLKGLIKAGLVTVHQFHASRRGGLMKLLEVTDYAYQQLGHLGINRPSPVMQGGWEHNLAGHVLGKIGQRENCQVSYEVPVGANGDSRIDVVWQTQTGRRLYFQCGVSSVQREVDAIRRALKSPAVSVADLILIGRDKKFATQALRLLKSCDDSGRVLQNISIRLIGDLLECYYTKLNGNFL